MKTNQLTELDEKLREMALTNWPQFVAMIGADAITSAKVCLLRQDGNKYDYISKVLDLTKNQVQYSCSKCERSN